MKTRIGGRERTILAAVLLAASLIVAAGSTAHAAYPAQQPPRFFQETGFGIDDPFFSYFQSRGGVPVRSVADPLNVIQESEGATDPSRESEEANESVVILAVEAGRVVGVAR